MKLTKQQEAEIWQVYDTWLTAYLNADVKTYNAYFDDDYHFIGSTVNEEFLNRNDATTFFEQTGEQFAGIMDLRNEIKILEIFNTSIFITHFCDVWFINDKDRTYYGRFRLSSVMQKKNEVWRFIYQHFSMPDSKSDEGETIGFDKVNAENIELKEAIKRRTIELENKNRELEIEAALERVRARSSAMQYSDELGEVIALIFTILDEFDISVNDGVALITFNEASKDLNEWMANPGFGTAMNFHLPYFEHPVLSNLWDAKNRGEDFLIERYSAEESRSFLNHIFEHSDFIHTPQPVKDYCLAAGTYATSIALQKHTAIFINDYSGISLTSSEVDLLKRFSAVFEQTYTRFLDIQKAEAQAREAQIEVALEKVRAQTMGMQASDDLSKVASVMFDQMKQLGGDLFAFGIVLCEKGKDTVEQWHNLGNEGMISPFSVPVDLDYIHRYRYDQWKSGEKLFSIEIPEDYIAEHFKLMFELPSVKATMDEIAGQGIDVEVPEWEIDYGASFKHGYLLVSSRKPFEKNHIFPRFAKAFDQAYTRFLDLQKAEAQTREAQIEAALEKVRSQSLAMHNSDELNEVVSVLFEKLKELQIPFTAVGIATGIEGSKDLNVFVCGENEAGLVISNYRLPYFDNLISNDLYSALEKQLDFFVGHYSKEEKNSFYEYVIENTAEFKHLPEDIKQMIFESPTYTISTVAVKNAVFNINDFEGKVLANHEVDIIKRFARVFDQAYTRFLDLQKAEAQAREARIEAALERVRSRLMAMHKSEELKDVVKEIFDQLANLSINAEHAGIVVDYEAKKDWHFWVAETQDIPAKVTVPYLDQVWDRQFTEAKREGKPFFTTQLNFDEKNSFYKILLPNIEGLTEKARDFYFSCPGLAISTVIEKDIGLYIENFSGTPYSGEENDILKRFGKVFQQAYTRFLDLQKAEAQTREAQINLAVERVRARALAMFKSEEILEVVHKLKEEIMGLDIPNVTAATIHLREPDGKYRAWDLTSMSEEGNELEISLDIRWHREDTHPDFFMREVWDRTEDYFVVIQGGDRYKHTVQWLHQNGHSDYAEEFEEFLESSQLEKAYHPTVPLNNGRMCIDLLDPPAPEIESILKKMAGAFDLAYKRFEDLQKAEAQARESEIQLALERVRARTMAMKKSDELREAVLVIYEQLEQLHFEATGCNIIIMDKESGSMQYWVSGFTQDIYPESYHVPFFNHPYLNAQIEPWKQGDKYSVMEYSGEEKKRFDEIFFSKTGFKNVPEQAKLAMKSLKMAKLSTAYCRYGALQVFGLEPLSEKKGEILRRFAKVFEQTYTRFLDLQKAEAQTREAQIEAGLERARAQSMMMQHSDEINTISNAFHEQLNLLGIPSEFSYVWLPDEANETHQFWASWSEVKAGENLLQSKQITYPLDKSEPYTAACFAAWANPDVILEEFIPPQDITVFFDVWQELLSGAKKLKPEYFQEGIYYSEAYMRYGCFGINIRRKLSEEEKKILKRFSKEFERAYTRFLDLQKAEEQALLIREERDRLEVALNKLEATQDQLIQQEKLASLGQLTAGIAHEIKNPLNFVNNFSELSVELVEEAREEARRGTGDGRPGNENSKAGAERQSRPLGVKREKDSPFEGGKDGEAGQGGDAISAKDETTSLLLEILDDIEANLRKIHEHGSRADGIVKSMLQHSRGGDGKMEPTPLNPLIKEYVNLAFHGMRAGKEPIDVGIDLQLDENVGEVPLIAEDFSRVILNLCNNAFDAMRDKQTGDGVPDGTEVGDDTELGDHPKLTVRTKSSANAVTIDIEDNGSGILDEIRDKIMQPFFTTKKGTQGTGLGLSITNDIVKAHGGVLNVSTQAGKGTTFTIKLPIF